MTQLYIDIAFVFALMGIGYWLEGVGGKDGFWDEVLTPYPLGASGCFFIALFERTLG